MDTQTPLAELRYDYRAAWSQTFRQRYDLNAQKMKILRTLARRPGLTFKELSRVYHADALTDLLERELIQRDSTELLLEHTGLSLTPGGEALYREICAWESKGHAK